MIQASKSLALLRGAASSRVAVVRGGAGAGGRKMASTTSAATGANKLQNKSNPFMLEADAGALSTRFYHGTALAMAVMAPAYFLTPDSMTDGMPSKLFGLALAANFTAHSWIGMNYIAVDYIPKINKSYLGPFRYINLGMAALMFFGMGKIALTSPGGIKAVVKGPWTGKDSSGGDGKGAKMKDGKFEY